MPHNIYDTNRPPYNSVGRLEMVWSNNHTYTGSGALIDQRLVLTCAHNLVDQFPKDGRAKAVEFGPAWNSGVGRVIAASNWEYPDEYRRGEDKWDIGLVLLAEPVWSEGILYFQPQGLTRKNAEALIGQDITLTGYPGDKNGEMWLDVDEVGGINMEHNMMIYTHTEYYGSSGSPLYIYDDLADEVRQYAIHVQIEHKFQGKHGVLFTEEIRQWIVDAADRLLSGRRRDDMVVQGPSLQEPERTELRSVLSPLPYLDGFSLGAGVDAITGGTTGSALAAFETKPATVKSAREDFRRVYNEASMNTEIGAAVKGNYNIDGISVGATSSYLQKIKYSSLSVSVVAEWREYYHDYDEILSPTLSADAKKLAEDPAAFRRRFGDYVITGVRRGSRLVAVFECTAKTAESIDKFNAGLEASMAGVFTTEGSARFEKAAQENHIDVRCSILVDGYSGTEPSFPPSPEGVLQALEWIRKNATGVGVEAKLTHYSNLIPGYPRTIDVHPNVFVDLRLLYTQTWDIRAAYQSLPAVYQRRYATDFNTFDTGVTAHQSQLVVDQRKLDKYMVDADVLSERLRDVMDREAFYFKVLAKIGTEPPRGQFIEEKADGPHAWTYGYASYPQSEAVTIHRTSRSFHPSHGAGYQKKTIEIGPDPKQLIVGWTVYADWTDGTDGWWKKVSDEILLRNQGAVFFQSRLGRGCNWRVDFYTVDAVDYQFEGAAQELELPCDLPASLHPELMHPAA